MAELIPISNIDVPVIFRKYGVVDVSELRASIDAEGQKVPIRVRQRGGRYLLVDGYRRVQAARQLGWDEINADVELFTSMGELVKEAIVINKVRKPFSNMDLACLFNDWIESGLYNRNQIADMWGFESRNTVTLYTRLTRHPEQIQNYVHEEKFGIEIAGKLLRILDEEVRVSNARDYVDRRNR